MAACTPLELARRARHFILVRERERESSQSCKPVAAYTLHRQHIVTAHGQQPTVSNPLSATHCQQPVLSAVHCQQYTGGSISTVGSRYTVSSTPSAARQKRTVNRRRPQLLQHQLTVAQLLHNPDPCYFHRPVSESKCCQAGAADWALYARTVGRMWDEPSMSRPQQRPAGRQKLPAEPQKPPAEPQKPPAEP